MKIIYHDGTEVELPGVIESSARTEYHNLRITHGDLAAIALANGKTYTLPKGAQHCDLAMEKTVGQTTTLTLTIVCKEVVS